MAKGGGEVEAVVSLVLAVGLIVTALVVTGKATDATRSVESEAFQLAHSLSGYLTSLATVEEGRVELTLTHPLDIELFHMDGFFSFDRLREFLTNVRRLEVSEGLKNLMAKFESKGYYIFVTPYRAVGEGKDYYEVLGVPRHAAQSDIRRAYERLEQEWGPDSGNPSPLREERWQEIQEAYAVLGNKTTQATYDLTGGKELERKEFEFAYILAYPEDEQHDLEKKFEKPDKLCIIKERGKKLSVIEKC